jgi:hypothetical protein
MNLLNDEELTINICKFGGPLVLFICSPTYVWILVSVYRKDVSAGVPIEMHSHFANASIFLLLVWFGLWMCRKGYGWFGGKKRGKPEL